MNCCTQLQLAFRNCVICIELIRSSFPRALKELPTAIALAFLRADFLYPLSVRFQVASEDVQEKACAALCTLAANSAENQAEVAARGGVEAILEAMWMSGTSVVIQTQACKALSRKMV